MIRTYSKNTQEPLDISCATNLGEAWPNENEYRQWGQSLGSLLQTCKLKDKSIKAKLQTSDLERKPRLAQRRAANLRKVLRQRLTKSNLFLNFGSAPVNDPNLKSKAN